LEEFETLNNEKFDLVFTENHIEIEIKELKINKASGEDYITNEMLKIQKINVYLCLILKIRMI
jgi:hypothetical protein